MEIMFTFYDGTTISKLEFLQLCNLFDSRAESSNMDLLNNPLIKKLYRIGMVRARYNRITLLGHISEMIIQLNMGKELSSLLNTNVICLSATR